MSIDWNEAPEGYDIHIDIDGRSGFYQERGELYVRPNGNYIFKCDASLFNATITLRPQPWTGEGHPPAGSGDDGEGEGMSAEWNGTGLPPAHTKCEFQPWNEHAAEWRKVTVIAHWCAACGITYSWCHNGYGWMEPQAMRFRPIRTPKQIAEDLEREERIKGSREIWEAAHRCISLDIADSIWKAGYRKEVKS